MLAAHLSGSTRLAGVIGDPVRHSRSPRIHNAAFAALDLDWAYLAFPVPAGHGADAIAAMRTLGIDGLSVTMPHKQAVAEAVDQRSDAVIALGASNCVARDGDVVVGHNTDGEGFVAALRHDAAIDLDGASVAVLGAGGAAKAIIDSVGRAGADRIMVINRTAAAAEEAALLADVATVAPGNRVSEADIIVNATAVGMAGGPDPDGCPVDPDLITANHLVVDIVYQPLATPLLQEAQARGASTCDGLGMLVHQAALQFELWTGHDAPLPAMTEAVRADLGS